MPLLSVALLAFAGVAGAEQAAFVPGGYPHPSPAAYGEPERSAHYVTVRDGTRLAVNVYRPSRAGSAAGVAVPEKLPVVWVFTSSRRATVAPDGSIAVGMSDGLELVKRGYVFAVAETRGRGASFGHRRAISDLEEARDAYDVTEWLASQDWSDGNVGMYGGASLGKTQLSAAWFRPPHLKALFLGLTELDRYDGWQRGGIPDNPATSMSKHTNGGEPSAADDLRSQPVDADTDRTMLRAAVAEHARNVKADAFFAALPFRDSVSPQTGDAFWLATSPSRHLRELGRPGLAIYHAGGWYAESRRDTLLMLRNLPNPQRLIIGPWNPATPKPEREAERLAFFDRYLKGVRNGIDAGPRIAYYTMNRPAGSEWRYSDRWPLPAERRTRFYFAADGRLEREKAPARGEAGASDAYQARYDIASRSQFEVRGPMDLSAADRDAKALSYTTPPLEQAVEVTGHPVVRLWISAGVADLDFFVHLEHVDSQGRSTYVTDGRLRASHRRLHRPYYDTAGLPWHRSQREDVVPLARDEPAELVFDLLPTSYVFTAGSRIRIAVSNADTATLHLRPEPAPRVTVHRAPGRASHVELPLLPAQ